MVRQSMGDIMNSCIVDGTIAESMNIEPVETSEKTEQELRQAHEQLKVMVQERDLLIQEIHHRVKNNLQIITSLIDLQLNAKQEQQPSEILEDLKNRIQLMAILHDKLYHQSSLQNVNLGEYIKSIIDNLTRSYNINLGKIQIDISTVEIIVPFQKAIPFGLLVNEITSNALKHAFPQGSSGKINVHVTSDQNHIYITIADNGIGLPDAFDIKHIQTLGLQLVEMLVMQLKGTIHISSSKGTKINLQFLI